jgi:hypothetical protein
VLDFISTHKTFSKLLVGIKSPEVLPETIKRAEESIGNADVSCGCSLT